MKYLSSFISASVIVFLIGGHSAVAFDPAQYQSVIDGKKDCPFCDLSAANLTKVDLAGADLVGADLTDADLTSANLAKVNFTGADLTRVSLTNAVLTEADFTNVELDEVDLTGVDLSTAKHIDKSYCNWATKLPQGTGWICGGVTIQRQ
jgi:uncharacterized protein YjbI with pentapeptide repeats